MLAGILLYGALIQISSSSSLSSFYATNPTVEQAQQQQQKEVEQQHRRRLTQESQQRNAVKVMLGDTIPSYMKPLLNKDLKERKKLFDDTPPEEVKYWFEYTGRLQVRTIFFLRLRLILRIIYYC